MADITKVGGMDTYIVTAPNMKEALEKACETRLLKRGEMFVAELLGGTADQFIVTVQEEPAEPQPMAVGRVDFDSHGQARIIMQDGSNLCDYMRVTDVGVKTDLHGQVSHVTITTLLRPDLLKPLQNDSTGPS